MKLSDHLRASIGTLRALEPELERIERIGTALAERLSVGRRLLVAGNGGSAAEAQHLCAELVGRYGHERRALSALALHAETSSLTAITNDYGPAEAFARQVDAHGQPDDILLGISTSGESANVIVATERARRNGLWTIALTGSRSGRLGGVAETVIAVDSCLSAPIQEAHLVVIHLLCEVIDDALVMGDGAVQRLPISYVVP
jgi:D-sedoheptulose 7-phosphate isomerase